MVDRRESNPLHIRQAQDYDIAELVSLENECFGTYYRDHRFSERDFTAYLQSGRHILIVATQNSSVVGYVAGLVRVSRSGPSASLDSLAVLPPWRRKSIGNRLLQTFVEQARQRACKRITLEVAFPNRSGILFFSRQGFRRVRRISSYYGEGLDGIRMEREI